MSKLADFARSIGISPSLARQWKKRGKIVERDNGFVLDAGVMPGAVTLQSERDSVTDRDSVTIPKRDTVTVTAFDQVVTALSRRISQLEDKNECRDLEDGAQWQTIQRLEAENKELRQLLGETRGHLIETNNTIIALQVRVAALEAGQEKLKSDARTLYADSAEYEKRITALESTRPDPGYSVTVERMPPGQSLHRRGQIDPEGPLFGA